MSRPYIPVAVRAAVAAHARHRCGYCLTAEFVTGSPMDVEHIVPVALGGGSDEDNLWLACSQCNGIKGDRVEATDPDTGQTAPLFDPRRQDWNDHFEWSPDGTVVIGRTPTGRATVSCLQLNRTLLVNARWWWVAAGWHPLAD